MTPNKKLANGVRTLPSAGARRCANLVSPQNSDTPDVSRNFSSPSAGAPPPYEDDASAVDAEEKAPIETPAALAGRAIPAVQEAGKATLESAKSTLATAQEKVASIKDDGLRQRKVKVGESEKRVPSELAQTVKQSADGVSVPIVALLCLLSFLLAYFFF